MVGVIFDLFYNFMVEFMSNEDSLFGRISSKTIQANLAFPINGSTVDPFTDEGKQECLTTITNARFLPECQTPCFEREGFALQQHAFTSAELLKALVNNHNYYEPLELFLKSYFGSPEILHLGYILRDESSREQSLATSRPPAAVLHSDWNAVRINKLGNTHDPFIITNPDLTKEDIASFFSHCGYSRRR
jgi:hypothetical protein